MGGGSGLGLVLGWIVCIEKWADVTVREYPLLRVVVYDHLVGVRYSDGCVGSGVTGLEFVGAG